MHATFKHKAGAFRISFLVSLGLFFLAVNIAFRLALHLFFPDALPFSADTLFGLATGLLNDAATLVFILALPATLILTVTDNFLRGRAGACYCLFILFVFCALFLFTAFAEYFFWDEFSSRFNFIAVDYLIYTTEVMRNIVESYPVAWLVAAVVLLAAAATAIIWVALKKVRKEFFASAVTTPGRAPARLATLGTVYAAALLLFTLFTPINVSPDRFWNEYTKNGVYELFSAYRNNQLDYRAFYKTMDRRLAFSITQDGGNEVQSASALKAGTAEKRPNVVVVIMESMGSKWLGDYTPNLNTLANEGLSFTNMMATGTRTVRGIEAVMLSIPPTPGNSIVRRDDNDGLFTLGTVFRRRGYDLNFIYGGIGYFDNMNAFFSGNGYSVVDKLDFSQENATFSTAWGQCDEDLFAQAVKEADKSYATRKPFHQVLLTTSNHRPFTYPADKVALEPGKSRSGAVQYADYAIGAFMEEAKKREWFDNTVFVFVGDHPSAIAGKTKVPADGYGVACILYGPKFFAPERVDTLCSQIDVAPTLLASLGWQDGTSFFGTDARALAPDQGRAWISTYQLLGFRTNDAMVVLTPDEKAEVTTLGRKNRLPSPDGEALTTRAVASYQCAYDVFTEKKLKEETVMAGVKARPPLMKRKMAAFVRKKHVVDARSRLVSRLLLGG